MVSSYSLTMGAPRDARHAVRSRAQTLSGRLGFQFLDVIGWGAIDRDAARLHGFRDFPDQLDLEQAVVERGALDLNVVRQVELPFEITRRDTAVEEVPLGLVGLAS